MREFIKELPQGFTARLGTVTTRIVDGCLQVGVALELIKDSSGELEEMRMWFSGDDHVIRMRKAPLHIRQKHKIKGDILEKIHIQSEPDDDVCDFFFDESYLTLYRDGFAGNTEVQIST